jgi:hypothetical protein
MPGALRVFVSRAIVGRGLRVAHSPIVVLSQHPGAQPTALSAKTTATGSGNTAESNTAGYQ